MKNTPTICVCLYLFLFTSSVNADVFEMMDKQDKQHFNTLVNTVRSCSTKYDFECAEIKLKEAKKYINDKQDKSEFTSAQEFLATKRKTYELEQSRAAKAYELERLRVANEKDKEEYDSVMNRYWSSGYKVKVTFTTDPGKAKRILQQVEDAVRVRDPGGWINPYWVPTFHASAAYNDKGVVIGEWYTSYYEGMGNWNRYLQRKMDKLNIKDWHVVALGETSRPQSNYATSTPSSVTGNRPAASTPSKAAYKCDNNGVQGDSRLLAVCSDGNKYNIYCWTSGAYTGQCDTQAFLGKYSYSYVIENTCKNRGGLTCLEKR